MTLRGRSEAAGVRVAASTGKRGLLARPPRGGPPPRSSSSWGMETGRISREPRRFEPVASRRVRQRPAVLLLRGPGEQQGLPECAELHPGPDPVPDGARPCSWAPDLHQ